jgi:acyl-CoA synthetase (AMP-forming)/AMP-acid ligase II
MINLDMTMIEAFRGVAESRLDQEALVCGEVRATYGELLGTIDALARGLHALGVRKGDKVAMLLPPGADFVHVFFAVAGLGAVVAPLNLQLRERGLAGVLADAEPLVLVTSRPVEGEVLAQVPSLRHVLTAGTNGGPGQPLADVIAAGRSAPPMPPIELSSRDLLALLYTSGTTGSPKGTMHTHRSLIAPVVASLKVVELFKQPNLRTLGRTVRALARYRERMLRAATGLQTWLPIASWDTVTGLEILFQALLKGDRLVVMERFDPREALRLVERERVNILVAVPVLYQVLLGLDDLDAYDTSSLLVCGVGAAPVSQHLAQEIERQFNCAIHIGFGATEIGGGIAVTSLTDSTRQRTGTVGKPMPGVDVKIVDEERRELPAGQVGELACRTDGVMLGYYRAPEATAQVLDEDGWYYTGDLARIDSEGYLHIVGRKKDMIIRGGRNIYPAEVEAYLTAHEAIREVAVVGVPSALEGESVWAFVILEEGTRMAARELLDFCREGLELYKMPGQVRFVDDFPRSANGKPQKFRLREAALSEQKGGPLS